MLLDSAAGQLPDVTLVDLVRSSPSDSVRVANRLEGHAPYSHVDECTGSFGPLGNYRVFIRRHAGEDEIVDLRGAAQYLKCSP